MTLWSNLSWKNHGLGKVQHSVQLNLKNVQSWGIHQKETLIFSHAHFQIDSENRNTERKKETLTRTQTF